MQAAAGASVGQDCLYTLWGAHSGEFYQKVVQYLKFSLYLLSTIRM